MSKKIYLDHAATTPLLPEVFEVMKGVYLNNFGNASSLHELGQEARDILENARKKAAELFGVESKEIIFTGSGTESDNLAIQGVAFKNKDKGNHIITSSIEHPAVLNTCRYLKNFGFRVTEVPVDGDGILQLDKLQEAITDETVLITVMYANNEIGTIQPIKEIGEIATDKGIIFHTDAVQAFGKVPIDPGIDGFQLLSASAHKIYGPKGVGLLYMKGGGALKGVGKYIQPILQGGGHERGYRPATENVPGVVGMVKAMEITFGSMEEEMGREKNVRDLLIDGILEKIPDTLLNGHRTRRLPNNANFSFKYVEGESLLLRLDMKGYEVSTGSACSSKKLEASHVLLAIGLDPEVAHGSVRVTIGRSTDEEVVDKLTDDLDKIVSTLRAISPLGKK
ncbi:MAG: cysteine desulfurase family protein [Candidatus Hodarchaeota archaeon]